MEELQGEMRLLVQIRNRIIDSGRDVRYGLDAYGFVLASLDFYRSKTEDLEHIPAKELVEAVVELAALKYGPIAFTILAEWGLREPLDIGNVVYNLIDIAILSQDKDDSLDDFVNLAKFDEVVDLSNAYKVDKTRIKNFIDS